ncbi:M56 family metallopeptidase [Romboutsia sp.]|uniref:M56 family metallopeptidase n=1 Tax=Romboutsia sp. TaxID=1965302 RepID=UPI003F2C7F85
MQELGGLILQASFYGSIVAVVIILSKTIIKDSINAKYHYLIWLLLVVKLIIPFGPQSDMSLFNKIPVNSVYETNISYKNIENSTMEVKPSEKEVQQVSNTDTTVISKSSNTNKINPYIPIVWMIVTINTLAVFISSYYLIHRTFKKENQSVDENKYEILKNCKNKMGVKSDIKLMINDSVKTPSLLGIIKPKILIPQSMINLSDKELEYIFLHEISHHKRKDILINYILIILQSIHWFNPIIWYSFKKMREDMEIATDEMVLKTINEEEHKEYGKAILTVLERIKSSKNTIGVIGMIDDKKTIKKRIRRIKNMKFMKNKKALFSIVGVILILTLSGVLLTSARENQNNKGNESLEGAISQALLNSTIKFNGSEVETEGHIILDKEEKNNNIKVYMITSTGEFGFENGIFTLSSGTSCLPTAMTFEKDSNGNYKYINREELQDGAYYEDSIKKVFPKKLWESALNSNKYYEELTKQQEEQAKYYLKSINREAKVQGDYVEKKLADINVEAGNKLLQDKNLSSYPYWLGSREELVNGQRYLYEKAYTKSDGNEFIIYTKKKDGKVVEEYKYKIVGSNIELVK